MTRLILFGLFIALIVGSAAALKSCRDVPPARIEAPARAGDDAIVALRDGSTMVAKQGTIGRELVDWFASGDHSRSFELGGREFFERSADPTIESKTRLPRLVAMLKANPDVRIHVIGHSDKTDDAALDQALSEARARTVAELLEEGGILGVRISSEGRGSAQPIADNRSAEGRARNQRVSILLTRD